MAEKEKTKEEKKEKFLGIEVPTQTTIMTKDSETDDILSDSDLLRKIANDVTAIKKNLYER